MSQVRLDAVTKRFGGVTALDDVSLTVRQGEFFSLLGGSGCGKTTTLRLVAGFEPPTLGEIYFDDRPMSAVPANRRNTGMVFQNYALFPHLDVFGNVAFGLKARGAPAAEVASRVTEILRLVELEGLERRAVHDLSGGQQQRVAVARAAVVRPDILLLDEPLSNLDARLRKSTRAGLVEIQRSLGATTLYVTHDQEEALALSDRVAVMRAGRVEQVGSPAEVYEAPATAFVARFIGETNLLRAHWEESGRGWRAALEGGGGFAPAAEALRSFAARGGVPQAGAPLTVAVKPEAFRLAGEKEATALEVEARLKEYGGATTSIAGRSKAGPVLARLPSGGAMEAVRPGERLRLAFDAERALLFEGAPEDEADDSPGHSAAQTV